MMHPKKLAMAVQIALWGGLATSLPLAAMADTLTASSGSSASAASPGPDAPSVASSLFNFDVVDGNSSSVGTFTWDNAAQSWSTSNVDFTKFSANVFGGTFNGNSSLVTLPTNGPSITAPVLAGMPQTVGTDNVTAFQSVQTQVVGNADVSGSVVSVGQTTDGVNFTAPTISYTFLDTVNNANNNVVTTSGSATVDPLVATSASSDASLISVVSNATVTGTGSIQTGSYTVTSTDAAGNASVSGTSINVDHNGISIFDITGNATTDSQGNITTNLDPLTNRLVSITGSGITTNGLTVTGATTTNGVTNTGDIATTTLNTTGAACVGGALGVTGATTTNGVTNTGDVATTTLTTTGAASVGGTLAVTGATTTNGLANTGDFSSSGNASIGGNLVVGGTITAANATSVELTGTGASATLDGTTATFKNSTGHGVAIQESETTLSGGRNSTSLTLNDDGATFRNTSAGGPARVTGVADGRSRYDAVNYGQLGKAFEGAASAAALAALPQPVAGKNYSVGVGYGNFADESAVAFGAKANVGNVSFSAGGAFSDSEEMVNVGAGYSF